MSPINNQITVLTGASGFIGSAALEPLSKSRRVIGLSRKKPTTGQKSAIFQTLDLENTDDVKTFFKEHKPSHLVHAAWAESRPGGLWNAEENLEWIEISKNLIDMFYQSGGSRAVICGSCAEYAVSENPLDENTSPIMPTSVYGKAKDELHKFLQSFVETRNFEYVWARIFYLYGPGENRSRLVPSILNDLTNNRRAKCSHGRQIRDFAYVGDIGEGLSRLLESRYCGPVNLASGRKVTIKELARTIGEQFGRPDLIDIGALPARENEPASIVANIDRLKSIVNWSPPTRLEAGLAQTISDFKTAE